MSEADGISVSVPGVTLRDHRDARSSTDPANRKVAHGNRYDRKGGLLRQDWTRLWRGLSPVANVVLSFPQQTHQTESSCAAVSLWRRFTRIFCDSEGEIMSELTVLQPVPTAQRAP